MPTMMNMEAGKQATGSLHYAMNTQTQCNDRFVEGWNVLEVVYLLLSRVPHSCQPPPLTGPCPQLPLSHV